MSPKLLSNKPVDRLIDEHVTPEIFNDDAIVRYLDKIYEYGVTKLYSEVLFPIAYEYNLINKKLNLDTTSLSVYGEYDAEGDETINCILEKNIIAKN